MWGFQIKRSALHEQLLLAPESNPSEFVRRYLANKQAQHERARRGSQVGSESGTSENEVKNGTRMSSAGRSIVAAAKDFGARTHFRSKIRPHGALRA
jgi:hypothetical protein